MTEYKDPSLGVRDAVLAEWAKKRWKVWKFGEFLPSLMLFVAGVFLAVFFPSREGKKKG